MPELQKHLVDGQDIADIIGELQETLVGKPRLHVMVACLTIVFHMFNPDIDPPGLRKGVEDTTEWLHTYFNPIPKELVN